MMKGIAKFTVISIGGLLALMVVGMSISAIFGVKPQEIKEVDLIGDWMIYRIGFYIFVLLLWTPFCRFVTRPRFDLSELNNEDFEIFKRKREKSFNHFKSQWWKLALLLTFFEVVIIQQFGL